MDNDGVVVEMMENVGHAHTRMGSGIERATVWVWRRERKWFCLRGSGRPKVRKGAVGGWVSGKDSREREHKMEERQN